MRSASRLRNQPFPMALNGQEPGGFFCRSATLSCKSPNHQSITADGYLRAILNSCLGSLSMGTATLSGRCGPWGRGACHLCSRIRLASARNQIFRTSDPLRHSYAFYPRTDPGQGGWPTKTTPILHQRPPVTRTSPFYTDARRHAGHQDMHAAGGREPTNPRMRRSSKSSGRRQADAAVGRAASRQGLPSTVAQRSSTMIRSGSGPA